MPLDFPASPTDGQIYGNWVYSSAKGAWKAKPLTPGQAQPSATAPTNPSNGDQWYNTNDGNLYIYYNDGDTSQWVQVKSDATLSSTIGTRVTTLETYPSGLVPVVPTSVTVGSGSGSVSTTGVVSITGVNSVALNGCFTSTYRTYRIIYTIGSSTATSLQMRLRSSGVNNSANYYAAGGITRVTGATSSYATNNGADAGFGQLNGPAIGASFGVIDMIDTQTASWARYSGVVWGGDATSMLSSAVAGLHANVGTFDGLLLFPNAGTFDGQIQVYGYRS